MADTTDNPLNPVIDPITVAAIEQQVLIPIVTDVPTDSPIAGTREIYFNGTDYYLYIYENGAWQTLLLNPTSNPPYGDGSDVMPGGKVFQVDTNGTLTTSLVDYWTGDSTATGYYSGNTWTLAGTTTYDTSTKKVGSASFTTGTTAGNLLYINSNLGVGSGDATWAGWVKLNATGGSYYLTNYDNSAGGNFGFKWDSSNEIQGFNGNGVKYVGYSITQDTNWHFIVLMRTGSNLGISVDGSAVTTGAIGGSATNGLDQWAIGGVVDSHSFQNGYAHYDEVGIWGKALSTQEITDLYNGGSGQTMTTRSPSSTYTISGTTTLSRDMFYDTLIVANGGTLNCNGFKVFAKTSIEVQNGGTISAKGGDGGNGGTGVTGNGSGNKGNGGTAGTAGTGIPAGSLPATGNGVTGAAGINGGVEGTPNTKNGNDGVNLTNSFFSTAAVIGGNSGKGRIAGSTGFTDNSSTGGSAGSVTQTTAPDSFDIVYLCRNAFGAVGINASNGSGAGGGCGYGNNSADALGGGGGGGGSGASGGIVWLASPTIIVDSGGTITTNGGNGGNGGDGGGAINAGVGGANYGGGGGGGGASGNGGLVVLICGSYTNNGTISYAAGTAGAGGSGNTSGSNGSAGSSGNNGHLKVITV